MIQQPVILFDGVCNLCNESVKFVVNHDKQGLFKFASLQSEKGQQLLKQYNLSVTEFNSFVLIQNNQAYIKSTAALMVAKQLSGVVKTLYVFRIIPTFLRDLFYNFIALNRNRWFGKKDSCMIPTADLKARFLN
ncbi:MAG: thiol-disulfide oxidoreductase DCC family protein [Gloeobacteraceae cyanobacterium ES-bin-316]|nr:thiol-disulfide oxidoreductase DCC family protein [Ferruginibacter sp.]